MLMLFFQSRFSEFFVHIPMIFKIERGEVVRVRKCGNVIKSFHFVFRKLHGKSLSANDPFGVLSILLQKYVSNPF